ncbi:hypothetical protein ABIE48_005361 [Paenibacillus sp. OAE614]
MFGLFRVTVTIVLVAKQISDALRGYDGRSDSKT